MTDTFKVVPVVDSVLDCKEAIPYAVYRSGANITYQQQEVSGTASATSQNFNVIVPSEQTVMDRRVDWHGRISFEVTFPASPVASDANFLQYGRNCALCPYPFHSSITTISSTINNNTFSQNQNDVMPVIMKLLSKEDQGRHSDFTPVMPDNYLHYSDANGAVNNPLGGYNNSVSSNDFHPRGAFPLVTFATAGSASGTIMSVIPRTVNVPLVVFIEVDVTEPIMLSPFLFGHSKSDRQGIYGIQNFNLRINTDPSYPLLRCNLPSAYTLVPTVTSLAFSQPQLRLKYLTPKPEDQFPARNCVGYYTLERYVSNAGSGIAPQTRLTMTSSNLQLNMVPDKMVVFARRKNNANSCAKTDSFLKITGISINYNNAAGLLSSASETDLWKMSVEAGSNQSWLDFHGYANVVNTSASSVRTPLSGSVLCLDFSKHIQITESYYAPGSLGTFNLQYNVILENQDSTTINPLDYELVTVIMNSGVVSLQRGTCSVYQGILNKVDVLDASKLEKYYDTDVDRLVGSGFLDNLKSVVGSALMKARGSGMSAGAVTGGAVTGGAVTGGAVIGGKICSGKLAGRVY